MIAALRGNILYKSLEGIIVDVGGVGYRVLMSLSAYARLPGEGHEVSLLVHTSVRENDISLFGFLTPEERRAFLDLIGISGIGPRVALAVLSGISPVELDEAVLAGDISRLMSVPGVGRKTAERIPLELREKVEKRIGTEEGRAAVGGRLGVGDVIDALVQLGYPRTQAERVVREASRRESEGDASDVEALLKNALKLLGQKQG
ncbi:MAG: Holliday junction branch migration protein RuvA [Deltaproteobacteria bacterium]|nr:Holliday junction branch migration protein RuvA [Candidatus Zymogenaceae bacterium]